MVENYLDVFAVTDYFKELRYDKADATWYLDPTEGLKFGLKSPIPLYLSPISSPTPLPLSPIRTFEQNLEERRVGIDKEHWRWFFDYRNDPGTKPPVDGTQTEEAQRMLFELQAEVMAEKFRRKAMEDEVVAKKLKKKAVEEGSGG
ncbi:hypothetical protein AHAS_Ahas13G0150000 [Arachis hypogaea]